MKTYNLYDIVKNVIKSKNPKEYIKKIKNRKFIYGYYLIDKNELVKILEKSKSKDSKDLLNKIKNNKKTGYELEEKELEKKYNQPKQYLDIGKQLINYKKAIVKYFYLDDGSIYFRAVDVCKILEYKDIKQTIKNVKNNHRFNFDSLRTRIVDGSVLIEDNQTIYINESGLYELMLKSKKKEAKKFTDWITEIVLPSIRKQGYYKMRDKICIEDYVNKCCLYVLLVKENIYKYGITKNIKQRLNTHFNNGILKNDNNIVKIFEIDNYSNLITTETEFRRYCVDKKINCELEEGIEFFKSDNIDNELEVIKNLINKQVLYTDMINEGERSLDTLKILQLHNENLNKRLELEKRLDDFKFNNRMKILEKEIELEKLKRENITYEGKNIKQKCKNIKEKGKNIDKIKGINKCLDCNTNIFINSKRCNNCECKRRFLENKGNRPSQSQLLKDLKELKYYTRVGEKYGVSDNAVRKWLKTYNKYNKTSKKIII